MPTLANTYTNYSQVLQNINRDVLPLVIRPDTIKALEGADSPISEDALMELGYTRDNDYGYWVRPMYQQGGTGGYGGTAKSQGKGQLYAGGQGYRAQSYYGGGGGGYNYSETTQPNMGVSPGLQQTGYAGRPNNLYGQMPLITWRI